MSRLLVRPSMREIRVYTTGPRRRALLQAVEQYEEARQTSRRRIQRARLLSMLVNPYLFAVAGGGSLPTPYAAAADLLVWLRSDQGLYTDLGVTPATSNGDGVRQWNDLSSHNNHVIRSSHNWATSSSPTLVTSAVNGLPAINFNGSQYYDFPNIFGSLTSGEVFLVIKVDADPTGGNHYGTWHLGYTFGNSSLFPAGDGNWYEAFGTTTRFSLGSSRPNLASTYRVLNIYSATNDWKAYIDGSLQHTETTNTVNFGAGESGYVPTLGIAVQGYTMFGRMAEFLFYQTKLGGTDRATVTAALGARYGLF